MEPYTLVGVDGNTFAIIGYTQRAMRQAGMHDEQAQMRNDALSGDYNHLICVCESWLEKVNEKLGLA